MDSFNVAFREPDAAQNITNLEELRHTWLQPIPVPKIEGIDCSKFTGHVWLYVKHPNFNDKVDLYACCHKNTDVKVPNKNPVLSAVETFRKKNCMLCM